MSRLSLLFLMLALPLLAGCQGQDAYTVSVILSGQHRYDQGQYLIGDMYVLGGRVEVSDGATLEGALNMLAGDVVVAGTVKGEVTALGGRLTLEPEALVQGPINLAGGDLDRSPGATIMGSVDLGGEEVPWDDLPTRRSWSTVILQTLLSGLAVGGLAHVMASLAPRPLGRVAQAERRYAQVATAMGMLVLIVLPALLVMMAFTMVLIPFVLVLGLALLLVILYGWMGLGLVVGGWLRRWMGRSDQPAWVTGLGTAGVVMVINLLSLIPVLGLISLLAAVALALGAVLLTRLGLHTFVPATTESPVDLDSYRPWSTSPGR
ncbi:MAG: polymer-forming cytoskeletal protein [Candidatus Promineifilaceae bacterium]|nr:polymer-forming cytoskeletal protein [Candidatus Promineifilaceae bacterium]